MDNRGIKFMICNECNSEPFEVHIKEDLGYEHPAAEFDIEVTHCPFCGANLEWSKRGGFDLDDDDTLDA